MIRFGNGGVVAFFHKTRLPRLTPLPLFYLIQLAETKVYRYIPIIKSGVLIKTYIPNHMSPSPKANPNPIWAAKTATKRYNQKKRPKRLADGLFSMRIRLPYNL
jgi:hypothetical protein